MSSAGIQKLFCGIYSTFKCSFDEFVGEKVFSPSYSSAIFLFAFLSFISILSEEISSLSKVILESSYQVPFPQAGHRVHQLPNWDYSGGCVSFLNAKYVGKNSMGAKA